MPIENIYDFVAQDDFDPPWFVYFKILVITIIVNLNRCFSFEVKS